jgi:hypothetical protein
MFFNKTPGIDVYIYKTLEAISKKFFGPISVLGPRFNASEYLEYACRRSRQQSGRVEPRPRLDLEPKSYF